jgi:septum formation protein
MAAPRSRKQPERLVLASASPRRREILKAAGIPFSVLPTDVPEVQRPGESPRQFVRRLAEEKARAARRLLGNHSAAPVLGADTVVVIGRETLGKPKSRSDARRMLRRLSGRQHRVLTGLCLLTANGRKPRKSVRVASTAVKFRRLQDGEIERYIRTREPLDKAGAYAIQGLASKYVEWIRGCYFNVVGLPVSLLCRMLEQADILSQ